MSLCSELNRVGELTRKQLQATMQRLTKQRESDFVDMYDTLRHGLYSKEGIVEHVTEVLRQTERARHKKQAALYLEWDAAVSASAMRWAAWVRLQEWHSCGMQFDSLQDWRSCGMPL